MMARKNQEHINAIVSEGEDMFDDSNDQKSSSWAKSSLLNAQIVDQTYEGNDQDEHMDMHYSQFQDSQYQENLLKSTNREKYDPNQSYDERANLRAKYSIILNTLEGMYFSGIYEMLFVLTRK